MGSGFIFVKSSIRKNTQTLSIIFIMMILAVAMVNLFLMIQTDYKENFNREVDRLNGENTVSIFQYDNDSDISLLQTSLDKIDGISDYEITNTVTTFLSCNYGDGEVYNVFSFISKNTMQNKRIGILELMDGSIDLESGGIYLPLSFDLAGNYNVGDTITFSIDKFSYSFNICGFYNTPCSGTINCADFELVICDTDFEFLRLVSGIKTIRIGTRLLDESQAYIFETKISETILGLSSNITAFYGTNSIELQTSRYTSSILITAVLAGASVIFISLLFILIGTNLSNYIKDNIKSFGVLKAIGYQGKYLLLMLILEFLVFTIISLVLGILLSYALFNGLNETLEKEVAIPYQVHFLLKPVLITSLIFIILILFTVYFSARRIHKIMPINAIRDIKNNKISLKNHFPFENSKLHVDIIIALKKAFGNVKRNVIIVLTMIIVGITAATSLYIYNNFVNNVDTVSDIAYGQTADIILNIENKEENINKLLIDLKEEGIDNYYQYNANCTVYIDGKEKIGCYVTDDFDKFTNKQMLVKGTYPTKDDEIVLNIGISSKLNYNIGDTIILNANNKKIEYKITGLIQTAYYAGQDCMLSTKGIEKLTSLRLITYYIDINDETKIDEYCNKFSEKDYILSTRNMRLIMKANSASYIPAIRSSAVVCAVVGLVLLMFVLYLLVKDNIDKLHKEHGILKAIGYTNPHLMLQVTLSFMPVSIISIIVGTIISKFSLNALFSSFVSELGIYSFGANLSALSLIISILVTSLVTFTFVFLMSLRIKKLSPYHLFTNE